MSSVLEKYLQNRNDAIHPPIVDFLIDDGDSATVAIMMPEFVLKKTSEALMSITGFDISASQRVLAILTSQDTPSTDIEVAKLLITDDVLSPGMVIGIIGHNYPYKDHGCLLLNSTAKAAIEYSTVLYLSDLSHFVIQD